MNYGIFRLPAAIIFLHAFKPGFRGGFYMAREFATPTLPNIAPNGFVLIIFVETIAIIPDRSDRNGLLGFHAS